MKAKKCYLSMNDDQRNLALHAVIQFRSKAIVLGVDSVDLDRLIRKLQRRRWWQWWI